MTEPHFVPSDYSIGHLLGSGQTSKVYLATHPRWGEVALKLPRPEIFEQVVLRRMFENEVQITLSLDPKGVVRAFEGHPTGEGAYLALEYCAGGTLDQLSFEKGRLDLERAYDLILDVAAGLVNAHEHRVLHRDVKPANVFLDSEARAKLGDFGTGIFMADRNQERAGTAFYMAPEVFRGEPASVQSDIYSLGILAYEVLAGVRPFLGESYDALMMAHLNTLPKSLAYQRQDVPEGVARVVMKAMARESAKRFASVAAFRDALMSAANLQTAEEEAPVLGRAGRTKTVEQAEKAADTFADKEKPGLRGFGRWFGNGKK